MIPQAKVTVERREVARLTRSLHLYSEATKKSEAEILNRAGRNIGFRAASSKFTKFATAARVRADMKEHGMKQVFAWAAREGRKLTAEQARARYNQVLRAKLAARHYIRIGWGPAIRAFGGNPTRIRDTGGSWAASGGGTTARARRLMAALVNNSVGADEWPGGRDGLVGAMKAVADDMSTYAKRELAKKNRAWRARLGAAFLRGKL